MALIAHQPQGPYHTAFLRPGSWAQGRKLRSFVAFRLVDKTTALVPLKHQFYSRSQPNNFSGEKCFQVLSFKGSAHNDKSTHSDSGSKFTNTPVKFSHMQEEKEVITESPDVRNESISYTSEDNNNAGKGSLAIQKLFQKWLWMLRTQTLNPTDEVLGSPSDEVLGEKLGECGTSKRRKVTLIEETPQSQRSLVANVLNFDAAITIPLLIFIPLYLTVRMIYGAEVTRELTPLWVLGPLVVALYVKIMQGLCSICVLCFKLTARLCKALPSGYLLVSNLIAEGKLKELLWTHFLKPIDDIKHLDYKQFFLAKAKQLQEWAIETYLDFVESIWPFYCRTIRFLKKANLI